MLMAADQRRKRLNGASIGDGSSWSHIKMKKKKLKSSDSEFHQKSHVSLEWNGQQNRVVAKKEQIALSVRNLRPFIESVPHSRSFLADAFDVPQEIFKLEDLSEVLSYEVWQTLLSENEKNYLMQFLPTGQDAEEVMDSLLCGENFHFGSPFLEWGASLCSGDLHPDAVIRREQNLKADKKLYYSEVQKYHHDMIQYLQTLKENWEDSPNPENVRKISSGPKKDEKKIFKSAKNSRSRELDLDVMATSESSSWIAEDKACSSDNQYSPKMKGGDFRKRVGENCTVKEKGRNLITASDKALKMGGKAKKVAKLQRSNYNFSDGSKYMSYVKVTKTQYERVKTLKQSGKTIQLRSLNRILGNLDNLRAQPYEVFLKEEEKKLQEYWFKLANEDLPAAYSNWRTRQTQKQEIIKSLEQDMKEQTNVVESEEEENMLPEYGCESETRSDSNMRDEETVDIQNEEKENPDGMLQDHNFDSKSESASDTGSESESESDSESDSEGDEEADDGIPENVVHDLKVEYKSESESDSEDDEKADDEIPDNVGRDQKVESKPSSEPHTEDQKVESQPYFEFDAEDQKVDSEPNFEFYTEDQKVESEPTSEPDIEDQKAGSEPNSEPDTEDQKAGSEPNSEPDMEDDEEEETWNEETAKHENILHYPKGNNGANFGSPQIQSHQQLSSINGSLEFDRMEVESDKNQIMSKSDGTCSDVSESYGNLNTADISVMSSNHRAPQTSNGDVWTTVGLPPYLGITANHEYASTSSLSHTDPHDRENQCNPVINLESDLHEVVPGKNMHGRGNQGNPVVNLESGLHGVIPGKSMINRQTNDCSFSFTSQDRNELLQSLFKDQGDISYNHAQKRPDLDFQQPNNVLMGDDHFSGHFQEPPLTMEHGQKRQGDVFMPSNILDHVYSEEGRYLIPRQENYPLNNVPRQENYPPNNVHEWNTNHVHMSSSLQPHLNGGELLNQNWFSGAQQLRGAWNGSDLVNMPSQAMVSGNNADQGLFSVLSQCNQARRASTYDSVGSAEQFVSSRGYGMVGGGVHGITSNLAQARMSDNLQQAQINSNLPQAPNPFEYLGGRAPAAPLIPDDMVWATNLQHQNSVHDPMGKPYLRSWNQ